MKIITYSKRFVVISVLTIVLVYLSIINGSTAYATNVDVNANIKATDSSFLLNFDAFSFDNAYVGVVNNSAGAYTKASAVVDDPGYDVYLGEGSSFSLYVYGSDFENNIQRLILNGERLKVNVIEDNSSNIISTFSVPVIEPNSGTGINIDTGNANISRELSFHLGLTNSSLYNDNNTLKNISTDTTFTTELTFQYTEAF